MDKVCMQHFASWLYWYSVEVSSHYACSSMWLDFKDQWKSLGSIVEPEHLHANHLYHHCSSGLFRLYVICIVIKKGDTQEDKYWDRMRLQSGFLSGRDWKERLSELHFSWSGVPHVDSRRPEGWLYLNEYFAPSTEPLSQPRNPVNFE
jgi:hypothetical protein